MSMNSVGSVEKGKNVQRKKKAWWRGIFDTFLGMMCLILSHGHIRHDSHVIIAMVTLRLEFLILFGAWCFWFFLYFLGMMCLWPFTSYHCYQSVVSNPWTEFKITCLFCRLIRETFSFMRVGWCINFMVPAHDVKHPYST